MTPILLRVRDLRVVFGARPAVRDVSFDMHMGETLGVVGESGCGKSTLARAILRLVEASAGSVEWRGVDWLRAPEARVRAQRRELQIVFQNPLASLDPRMTLADAIGEPLENFEPRMMRETRRERIGAMLRKVGLSADLAGRYPHECSGGQLQRAGIARAMILQPKLLVCDEPVSSLDVSIQGQIVNLLADLQGEFGMAMLFISHNLSIVRYLSRRILVIHRGQCVESGACEELFAKPLHPYTIALLRAAAGLEPGATTWSAEDPSPGGCAYRTRCAFAIAPCETLDPPLTQIDTGHFAACHRAREFRDSRLV